MYVRAAAAPARSNCLLLPACQLPAWPLPQGALLRHLPSLTARLLCFALQVELLTGDAEHNNELAWEAGLEDPGGAGGSGSGRKKAAGNSSLNRLLNRLLGCPVELQERIFTTYMALQASEVQQAKAENR